MYSRFQNRPDPDIRIPEHYSGCAFSKPSPSAPKKPDENVSPVKTRPHPVTPTKPSPPPHKSPPPALLLPPHEEQEENTSKTQSPPVSLMEKPFERLGKAFPFSHGIGFDELLLLGLILLLSQSGKDEDTVLWLALLLFCG